MLAAILKYVPLVVVLAVLLFMIGDSWLIKDTVPPATLILPAVALAVVPLAGRLRIGDWFDFRKSLDAVADDVGAVARTVDSLQIQVSDMKLESTQVSTSQQNQTQQVFNFPTMSSEEIAKFAAQVAGSSPPRITEESISEWLSSKTPDSESYRRRFTVSIDARDTLAEVTTSLRAFFCLSLSIKEGRVLKADDYLHKELGELIAHMREDGFPFSPSGQNDDEDTEYLARLEAYVAESQQWSEEETAPSLEDVARLRHEGRFLSAVAIGKLNGYLNGVGLLMATFKKGGGES